jgi:hypothetical protein
LLALASRPALLSAVLSTSASRQPTVGKVPVVLVLTFRCRKLMCLEL